MDIRGGKHHWLHDNAWFGNPDADFARAIAYMSGIDRPRDFVAAADFFKRAAKYRHPLALYYLGRFYTLGLGGLPKSDELAFDSFHWAAILGVKGAMLRLATCYAAGKGCSVNKGAAAFWAQYANAMPDKPP